MGEGSGFFGSVFLDLSGRVGVTKAAKALGVSAVNRDAIDSWDGDIDESLILQDGSYIRGNSEMIDDPIIAAHAQPNEFYQ